MAQHPERVLVGHPYNPVYLLPLVEMCGGKLTDPGAMPAPGRAKTPPNVRCGERSGLASILFLDDGNTQTAFDGSLTPRDALLSKRK
ncbi:3-hydroxyacyl-CoA dehydrogenase NAD-binding domain-containing protein [Mesorhizobium sp. IMUNJ 23033]|uniref:3-hydroxyacyl-CoA dehydrogenase NAD-binding domain-containing protein n=1 Tax=Mesorhizobium sp. IMUNJ 23033 TaxID=3378039 RepID=UPI00384CEBAA